MIAVELLIKDTKQLSWLVQIDDEFDKLLTHIMVKKQDMVSMVLILKVISGERDPDAEGVTGMSTAEQKMRVFCMEKRLCIFRKVFKGLERG